MSYRDAFQGQTIWITGASSGIGAALAKALSDRGATLILSARREEKLQVVKSLCSNPPQHLVLPLDLTDSESIQASAQQVLETVGPIDILINSAGVSQRALAQDTALGVDRQIMETNYFGPVILTKAILPSMVARQSGQIVVISSLVGKFGTPLRSAYAASKHALHGFFDSLRAEVGAAGVRVTLICPGFIQTDISLQALTGDGTPHRKLDTAQAKGMPAENCAEAIVVAIARQKDEVLIGKTEVLAVYIKRFLPTVFNWLIRRVDVT